MIDPKRDCEHGSQKGKCIHCEFEANEAEMLDMQNQLIEAQNRVAELAAQVEYIKTVAMALAITAENPNDLPLHKWALKIARLVEDVKKACAATLPALCLTEMLVQAAQRGYKKGVEDAVDVIFNQEMEPSELLVWADSASNTYADQLHPSITDNKGNIPPF